MNKVIKIFEEAGVKAFVSGLGHPKPATVAKFHEKGILVGSIAGKLKHATNAVDAGVDFIIAQGGEAGGHTGSVATTVLLPQIVDAVAHRVPVVAAGGIFDGRGLAAALSMGASGVWIGTRFLMTPEAYTRGNAVSIHSFLDPTLTTYVVCTCPYQHSFCFWLNAAFFLPHR